MKIPSEVKVEKSNKQNIKIKKSEQQAYEKEFKTYKENK